MQRGLARQGGIDFAWREEVARAIGQARARRWLAAPLVGFTTILLLPTAQPIA